MAIKNGLFKKIGSEGELIIGKKTKFSKFVYGTKKYIRATYIQVVSIDGKTKGVSAMTARGYNKNDVLSYKPGKIMKPNTAFDTTEFVNCGKGATHWGARIEDLPLPRVRLYKKRRDMLKNLKQNKNKKQN
jgi:hypothetical protein